MNRTRKIERVAAYIRVSSQEQKLHGLSLDAQKMKLIAYAKKHGMKIVEWYMDEGVSGRKLIRKRPELQRMIQDAEKGQFERIIFIKLDRFFRSVAEYHECMKRIAPVLWTTTEEEYDLSTANGRMLVNMKLTIAELEADQGGERIKIVNDYKTSTGQPLTGSIPFGFKIVTDETGRKKIIKDPEYAEVVDDIIQHYLTHQSRRATLTYLHTKHHISMRYNSLKNLFANTMLYGAYRDNPNYCEAYIDKATFDRMQTIGKQNIKENTVDRSYLFSGLIVCPECGCRLAGSITICVNKYKVKYPYKRYRCANHWMSKTCGFNGTIRENTLQKLMLANIERYLANAKISSTKVEDGDDKPSKYNIDEIHGEIDRLNYSWQKGRIRTVEQYEEQYAVLMEKLEKAEAEQGEVIVKDFSRVEAILQSGWKAIYENLDDKNKRAFWRSFIKTIEVVWTKDTKRIKNIVFF